MASISDMAHKYSEYTGLSLSKSKQQWSEVCKFIYETLSRGEAVTITGVGKMEVRLKKERVYNDPRNNGKILAPAHYAPVMKFSSSIKRDVKENIQTL